MRTDGENSELTKRELFAAMALQGYLASFSRTPDPAPSEAAKRAVWYADALINELNKDIDKNPSTNS